MYIYTGIGDKLNKNPKWSWVHDNHFKEGFLFWFIKEGSGTLEVNGTEHPLRKGEALLLPFPGRYVGGQNKEDLLVIPWIHGFISPSPKLEENAILYSLELGNQFLKKKVIRQTSAEILFEEVLRAPVGSIKRNVFFSSLLYEIFDSEKPPLNKISEEMEDIKNAIDKNPQQYNALSDLPLKSSYTKDHFIRIFKGHTGLTPHEYIVQKKIEKAKIELSFSSTGIEFIAYSLGYGSVQAFHRQFKSKTGYSPGEYRKTIHI